MKAKIPEYSHRQKAPLCLLIYALAVVFLALGYFARAAPPLQWMFPSLGLLMLVLAASFHDLTIEDQGESLAIRFGPVPLYQKLVRYEDIGEVQMGRTSLLDGWGIHYSFRSGWLWNLWGRDCVAIHFKNRKVFRVGTDDPLCLVKFLQSKIALEQS